VTQASTRQNGDSTTFAQLSLLLPVDIELARLCRGSGSPNSIARSNVSTSPEVRSCPPRPITKVSEGNGCEETNAYQRLKNIDPLSSTVRC